jgi:DNA polymerase-3 subunit epsilon
MHYAIVDIETTGGYASGSGITEIAILIHDGTSVIDRYETLVNPGRPIPFSIQALTGIDDKMVADSPSFNEVADKVYAMLSGCIFIAHNVNFDYSFIKYHLLAAGYDLNVSKLCTVRLSRKIKPGLASYSLGKLCNTLGINLENRHRAGGDADATAILFSKLLAWDTSGYIPAMLKKTSKEQQLPPNLPREDFFNLPSCPGVYYFLDETGKEIYVGKAINIKKRVSSHFTGHNPNPQRQHFLRSIFSIHYESCGTELMALLLETAEIKRLWPLYNRAMKRPEPKFALYGYEDFHGYKRLAIGKHGKFHDCIHVFNRESEGIRMLRKLVIDFGLTADRCAYGRYPLFSSESEDIQKLTTDTRLLNAEEYNNLVEKALTHFTQNLPSFLIVDTGRNADENSCIWVEKGRLSRIGYVSKQSDLTHLSDIKALLKPCFSNHYMNQLIFSYAEKYPLKVIRLTSEMTIGSEIIE